MPMTERFYSVNGQMMGYESGGVKKDFLTDHLGSITAEIDQTQTRTYDTRYSAYGRNNWSIGTGCGFGWVGSYGYRETGLFHMSHYVRARHYSYVTGAWSTVDPLWPDESTYGYVGGRATQGVDPTGTSLVCLIPCAPCAACGIDFLLVCPPGPGFVDCAKGVIEHLPPWLKWTCGLSCAGCLLCLMRGRIPKPKIQPPKLEGPALCFAACMSVYSSIKCAGLPPGEFNYCVMEGYVFCRGRCYPGGGGGGRKGIPIPLPGCEPKAA
jgi:RHS repeat-associated protein